MNQFSSGQPSALASCRGARTLQGEACSLSSPRPAFRLDTQTPGLEGDTGCPPGGNTGPRAACWGEGSIPLPALGNRLPLPQWCAQGYRPGLGARQWRVSLRGKAAQFHHASCLCLLAIQSASSAQSSRLVPSGWRRLLSALRPLSRLSWYRGRPCPLPRTCPPPPSAGPKHLPPAPLRGPGANSCPEERSSCLTRPAAPDKLAICCCLSSAFVMQIPKPACGAVLPPRR